MSVDEISTSLPEQGEGIAEVSAAFQEKVTPAVPEETPLEHAAGEDLLAATPAPQAETSAGLLTDDLQVLSQRVEQLASLLEEANNLSRERERIVDRLHQENQQLRAGEISQAVAPVFRDLVRLYDDLMQTGGRYEGRPDADVKEVAADFRSFCAAVEDVLYRHGVERYDAQEGSSFNSKEQKALGTVPTENAELDRAIVRVVRAGFRTDKKIIRILEAEVFRFTPATALTGDTEVTNESAVSADQPTEEKGQ